jgi:predicted ATPase/class 3 adenylate cyclase
MMASVGELPAGIVTFVFSDIEGSTRLFHRIGDRYPRLLGRHNRILRDTWRAGGGAEVKTEGDSFFVAFADAAAALDACAAGQAALGAEPWPPDAVIRVRMGVHCGLAYPREGDYIAYAVHQAARVVAVGHGGQIVVSDDVASRGLPTVPLSLRRLGAFRLRDFDGPVDLHQVVGPGLPDDFPPLRTPPAEQHNLVRPVTPLIGQENALNELSSLVTAHRLVSVVGPGGLGKTRLAIEWGIAHATEWRDGIWFADLTAVTDPHAIPEALVAATAAPTEGDGDLWQAVVDHLRERRCALIVDNCEHLLTDVARRVDALLAGCPGVHVVATSRESLGLRSERIWRPEPLVASGAAIELFSQRAGIEPDDATRDSIQELCERLDGLPLAIELAAARAEVISPAEILRRLDSHPNLIASRDPTLDPRHRALQELIDWSYRLLSAAEQAGLASLAVFAGGFDLDAAVAAIANDDIAAYDAAELVWSLLGKSLLVHDTAGGATRYRMLMTVRAFARQHLEESGLLPAIAARTARHFLATLGPQIQKIDPAVVFARSRELDNLRSLLADVAPNEPACGQELAKTILVEVRAINATEALAVGHRYLEQLTEATPQRVGLLLAVALVAIDGVDRLDDAEALLDEAEALATTCPLPLWADGQIEQVRGLLLISRGASAAGLDVVRAGLGRVTTSRGRARLYNVAGMAAAEAGDGEGAMVSFEEAAALDLEDSALESASIDLANVAEVALRLGDGTRAAARQLESLDLALALGLRQEASSAWIVASRLADSDGDHETAVWLQAAADALLEVLGIRLYPSDRALCDAVLERGRTAVGNDRFTELTERGRLAHADEVVSRARPVLIAKAGGLVVG